MELATSIILAFGFGTLMMGLRHKVAAEKNKGKIGLSSRKAVGIIIYLLIRPSLISFHT